MLRYLSEESKFHYLPSLFFILHSSSLFTSSNNGEHVKNHEQEQQRPILAIWNCHEFSMVKERGSKVFVDHHPSQPLSEAWRHSRRELGLTWLREGTKLPSRISTTQKQKHPQQPRQQKQRRQQLPSEHPYLIQPIPVKQPTASSAASC